MRVFGAIVLSVSMAACGCAEGGEHHDQNVGGVMHAAGYNDPRRFCCDCHGADLHGDRGPSCYACHTNADHTAVRGAVRHNPAATTRCKDCHGPEGRGGLGPSCLGCHASYPA